MQVVCQWYVLTDSTHKKNVCKFYISCIFWSDFVQLYVNCIFWSNLHIFYLKTLATLWKFIFIPPNKIRPFFFLCKGVIIERKQEDSYALSLSLKLYQSKQPSFHKPKYKEKEKKDERKWNMKLCKKLNFLVEVTKDKLLIATFLQKAVEEDKFKEWH